MSLEENKMENGTIINATKIVIQDYNTQRKYFIVPENGNSTVKCIYTDLEGEMIPRHLLKHATLKSENIEGNVTHSLFQVDNDTDVDVYRSKGRHGKIYEILLHLPNGSLHMRSKEQEMNFTDYKHLNCYRYIEENDTIEESFYESNDSKLYQETSKTHHKWFEEDLRAMPSNITVLKGYSIPLIKGLLKTRICPIISENNETETNRWFRGGKKPCSKARNCSFAKTGSETIKEVNT